jgi:hypothetical protein
VIPNRGSSTSPSMSHYCHTQVTQYVTLLSHSSHPVCHPVCHTTVTLKSHLSHPVCHTDLGMPVVVLPQCCPERVRILNRPPVEPVIVFLGAGQTRSTAASQQCPLLLSLQSIQQCATVKMCATVILGVRSRSDTTAKMLKQYTHG